MPTFFATCPRGLEALLADELTQSGAIRVDTVAGGAGFEGSWETCYRANLESRIATRILWRVGHAPYKREEDIYKLAYGLPWQQWFAVRRTLRVYMTAIRCPLKSLDFITLRIKDAVCDRFRAEVDARPSVDTAEPDVRIHAFLTDREATLYLDTSGDALYMRGYKYASVGAPLKENLAAGILRLSGWQPGTPLLDPMCGSGTFLIEAAQMAHDIAPGLGRPFGFARLENFDEPLWHRLRAAAEARRKPIAPQAIHGSDIDVDMVERARQNLAAARLDEAVRLQRADLLELAPPAPEGVLVANPPYGVRLGEEERLAAFYPKLGDALKQRFAGWRCYLFSGDPQLPRLIGLKASRRTPLYNGALECRLLEYKVVSGQMRGRR
ncbi:MAG: RNA methyltransferase [Rhodocyclaceae bacterium]|jgi:putative N6-adenine-specific DNA methylase|nr:RNA methyltransferase [Rhodocyclaceae bacterium]